MGYIGLKSLDRNGPVYLKFSTKNVIMIHPQCLKTSYSFNTFIERILVSSQLEHTLKGKFSSGIEGALASTLNHDFNWKQLSEMILCIFLLMFSKFI